jgi:probable O-glycosylation ligase (exosortase A-associated)
MRDLLVLGLVLVSVPVGFFWPWIGTIIFAWLGYMNPHRYAWGVARAFPVAQAVALAVLAGMLFTRDRGPMPRRPEVILLFLLWGYFTLTTFFALNEHGAWMQWEKVSKILLMTFVTMWLINTPTKLRLLLMTIAMSVGLLGLKGAMWVIASGGQNRVLGPPGSFLGENNEIGLALNMTLPLLFYLARDERRPWLRQGLRALFVACILAAIFTYSRGAVITLAAVGAILLVRAKRKGLAMALGTLAVAGALYVVPQHWTERMESIGEYQTDRSFQGRLDAWGIAWNLATDRPLTGGGFEALLVGGGRDVHSIYFEILGEHGFVAFGLWAAMILCALGSLRWVGRATAKDPRVGWARHYPAMLETSLAGYLVGGLALGLAYFDYFYHLVAATAILRALVERSLAPVAGLAAGPAEESPGGPRRRPRPGGRVVVPARATHVRPARLPMRRGGA